MNIRPATADDLDDLCRLADEIAEQHHAGAPELFAPAPGALRDRPHWSACLAAAAGTVLIAESQGRPIGFVTARITDTGPLSFLQPRRACRIGTLVVQASHRGQGCGRRLMMAVDDWARGQGADELLLEVMDFNQRALDFYRRLAFSARSHTLARPLDGPAEPEWLAIARSRVGVQSGPPGLVEARTREHEARADPARQGDEIYLCSWFVNWSLGQAGLGGTNSALARAWLAWGHPLQAPRPGCVVVIWRDRPDSWKGHVGLCLREDAEAVHVLGASQFHEVGEHAFPRSHVLGYRWP